MDRDQRSNPVGATAGAPPTYEAPRIESVLTPADLEREVQYAGGLRTATID